MKYWMWSVFVAAVTMVVMVLLRPPLFLFLLVAVPVMVLGFTVSSFYWSFRSSLQAQPVPASGYGDRIAALERCALEIEALGFSRCDQFYLKTIPDSLTYAFRHRQQAVYFCVYHFGAKMSCDIVSRFADDHSLTTGNAPDGGNIPRPAGKMLQIFPHSSFRNLWIEHQRGLDFLAGRGFREWDVPLAEFRSYFLGSIQEFKRYVLGIRFWPVKLIFWVVSGYGRKYCRRIEEQQLAPGAIAR